MPINKNIVAMTCIPSFKEVPGHDHKRSNSIRDWNRKVSRLRENEKAFEQDDGKQRYKIERFF
jgi:hypothetical protein